MADTFSNDLRLRLQESGSNAGTWGDLLNGTITNIASGFGQGSEAIPNASTHTITLADGTADEARSLYLKCTGGGQACTVTLGPNTISKVWIIDNATSYTLTFSQGSGANVAIAAGAVKVIATDGAGSGAAVVDTLDGLEGSLSSLAVTGEITANGGIALGDSDKATFGTGDDLQIYHDGSNSIIKDAGTGNLEIQAANLRIKNPSETKSYLNGDDGGAITVFYDGSQKLATTSTGLDVSSTGEVISTVRSTSTSGARQATLRLNVPSTGGDDPAGRLQFTYDTGYTVAGSIEMSHTNPAMKFLTGATEAMRLSGGNLLVGKTDTSIGVAGSRFISNGQVQATASGQEVLLLNRLSSDGELLNFRKDSATVASIGVYSGVPYIGYQGGAGGGIMFNGKSIEPTALGSSRTNGENDIGSSSYRWKDLYLSGVANVGSIVQTGSTSSLVASFENTNTSGYGMRITTYSSGVEYALAVDSYGGGYSRDFVIGVDGIIVSPPTYGSTTGFSANMYVNNAGRFFRATSSARYKNTIRDATHGLTELLTLRPVTYKGNNDGDTVFGGLIAEEVHDAGLTEFVQYNDEDEPDALAYGNMVSLCIKAIQELKEELNTATARITELENT